MKIIQPFGKVVKCTITNNVPRVVMVTKTPTAANAENEMATSQPNTPRAASTNESRGGSTQGGQRQANAEAIVDTSSDEETPKPKKSNKRAKPILPVEQPHSSDA